MVFPHSVFSFSFLFCPVLESSAPFVVSPSQTVMEEPPGDVNKNWHNKMALSSRNYLEQEAEGKIFFSQ